MPPRPVRPPPPSGGRSRPKRGPLGWLMILLGLTLFAGATACLVQNIQCTCPGRIKCTDIDPSKRKWPCCTQSVLLDFFKSRSKHPC